MPKQIEDSNPENESQDRATGDRLRVTGSGALYVENVDDFLASKRVQKTISSVNRRVAHADQAEGGRARRKMKRR